MKDGISLEQLKEKMDSQAQRDVVELKEKLAKAEKLLEKRDQEAYFLMNRCTPLSGDALCTYCGVKMRCILLRKKYQDGIPRDKRL